MANEILNRVYSMETGCGAGGKAVLAFLANMANEEGNCWPKQRTIADALEMSLPTVQRHIKDLQEKGFLKCIRAKKGEHYYYRVISNCDKVISNCDKGLHQNDIRVISNCDKGLHQNDIRVISNCDNHNNHKEPTEEPSMNLDGKNVIWNCDVFLAEHMPEVFHKLKLPGVVYPAEKMRVHIQKRGQVLGMARMCGLLERYLRRGAGFEWFSKGDVEGYLNYCDREGNRAGEVVNDFYIRKPSIPEDMF